MTLFCTLARTRQLAGANTFISEGFTPEWRKKASIQWRRLYFEGWIQNWTAELTTELTTELTWRRLQTTTARVYKTWKFFWKKTFSRQKVEVAWEEAFRAIVAKKLRPLQSEDSRFWRVGQFLTLFRPTWQNFHENMLLGRRFSTFFSQNLSGGHFFRRFQQLWSRLKPAKPQTLNKHPARQKPKDELSKAF